MKQRVPKPHAPGIKRSDSVACTRANVQRYATLTGQSFFISLNRSGYIRSFDLSGLKCSDAAIGSRPCRLMGSSPKGFRETPFIGGLLFLHPPFLPHVQGTVSRRFDRCPSCRVQEQFPSPDLGTLLEVHGSVVSVFVPHISAFDKQLERVLALPFAHIEVDFIAHVRGLTRRSVTKLQGQKILSTRKEAPAVGDGRNDVWEQERQCMPPSVEHTTDLTVINDQALVSDCVEINHLALLGAGADTMRAVFNLQRQGD